eukprot:COSAG01_NODE_6807_length_3488_cov_18.608865_2_plen_64_part_00
MRAPTAVPYALPAAGPRRPAAQHQCIRAAHARLLYSELLQAVRVQVANQYVLYRKTLYQGKLY